MKGPYFPIEHDGLEILEINVTLITSLGFGNFVDQAASKVTKAGVVRLSSGERYFLTPKEYEDLKTFLQEMHTSEISIPPAFLTGWDDPKGDDDDRMSA